MSGTRHFVLPDERATRALGERLGQALRPPFVLHLRGELGAGKTTLARALVQSRSPGMRVKSPTYTLIERYDWPNVALAHLDLYRIADPEELEFLGLRDLAGRDIVLIEWPERGGHAAPAPDLTATLMHTDGGREAQFTAHTAAGTEVLKQL